VRLAAHQLTNEQRLFWRSRELAFFTFALPIVFFVLLGSVYGNDEIDGVKGSSYLFAGMLGYGVAATAFAGLAITTVIRREDGVLKRLRGTPLPAPSYIAAVLGSTMLVFTLEAVALVLLGRLLFDVPFPDRWLSLALMIVLGALAFAAMGLGLTGAVHSAEGSSAVVNAIYLPMAFISGSFFSASSFPPYIEAIADVLPLTYFIELCRNVLLYHEEIWANWQDVAIVAAWGLAGALAAARWFRWEPYGS
jgi:ABC-2 type transport system permease protein